MKVCECRKIWFPWFNVVGIHRNLFNFISIFVTTVFGVTWEHKLLRVVFKLILIPVVTGIAYEVIMLAGRYDNIITRIVSAPGLWIQRITTSEPTVNEIECAIAAMKAVIPEDGADKW